MTDEDIDKITVEYFGEQIGSLMMVYRKYARKILAAEPARELFAAAGALLDMDVDYQRGPVVEAAVKRLRVAIDAVAYQAAGAGHSLAQPVWTPEKKQELHNVLAEVFGWDESPTSPAEPATPVTECHDSDSPWLVCKPCAAAGKCAQAQPVQAPSVPLTDEHIGELFCDYDECKTYRDGINFARAIEAAHGIGAASPTQLDQ